MQQHVSRVWHNAADCSQFAFSFSLLDVNATRLGCSVLYSEARTTLLWCTVHVHVRVLVNDTYVRPRPRVQYCSRTVRSSAQFSREWDAHECAPPLRLEFCARRRRIRALSNAPERNCWRRVSPRLVRRFPSHPVPSDLFRSVLFRSVRERSCGRLLMATQVSRATDFAAPLPLFQTSYSYS